MHVRGIHILPTHRICWVFKCHVHVLVIVMQEPLSYTSTGTVKGRVVIIRIYFYILLSWAGSKGSMNPPLLLKGNSVFSITTWSWWRVWEPSGGCMSDICTYIQILIPHTPTLHMHTSWSHAYRGRTTEEKWWHWLHQMCRPPKLLNRHRIYLLYVRM